MSLAITAPGHKLATGRAPHCPRHAVPVFAMFGEGHRVGGPGPLSVCCCCSLPLRPPCPQSDPCDRVALPCQPSQMKPAPTSSMATSRWTAPRTSTLQAPWSSTGGPWTSTRPVSSTLWLRGPPTRASTSWCVRLRQRPHAVAPVSSHEGASPPSWAWAASFHSLGHPLLCSLIHSITQILMPLLCLPLTP